ncbi:hypothetical protein BKA64DRAFT_639176 [Cadophora sp. MPI-SDFR-AT-0126]|nr:hypothetical protein BKA64DRAFT_639176 [Leotiomycetes sp. MPI-SDFR-AT-0126]
MELKVLLRQLHCTLPARRLLSEIFVKLRNSPSCVSLYRNRTSNFFGRKYIQWWQNLMVYNSTSVVVECRSQFMEVRANDMEPVYKPAPRRRIDIASTSSAEGGLATGEDSELENTSSGLRIRPESSDALKLWNGSDIRYPRKPMHVLKDVKETYSISSASLATKSSVSPVQVK